MSSNRYPFKFDLATLLKQDYPTIDLDIDAYDRRMHKFEADINTFAEKAMRGISNQRDAHLVDVRKLADRAVALQEQTRVAQVKEIELAADLEREVEEFEHLETEVETLRRQADVLETRVINVADQNAQVRAHSEDLKREKARDKAVLEEHAAVISVDMDAVARLIGARIEGVGREALLFTFANLVPKDPTRECSFALDVSGDHYRVLASEPVVPTMGSLLVEANATGNIWMFVTKVRQAFVASFKDA